MTTPSVGGAFITVENPRPPTPPPLPYVAPSPPPKPDLHTALAHALGMSPLESDEVLLARVRREHAACDRYRRAAAEVRGALDLAEEVAESAPAVVAAPLKVGEVLPHALPKHVVLLGTINSVDRSGNNDWSDTYTIRLLAGGELRRITWRTPPPKDQDRATGRAIDLLRSGPGVPLRVTCEMPAEPAAPLRLVSIEPAGGAT